MVEHHPLIREFPELRERIRALKGSDQHFSRLFDAYEVADKAVVRAENGVDHLGTNELEGLKKQRLALKDQLYTRLRQPA